MNRPYIICAAIHFKDYQSYEHQPINIKTGYILAGRRHHNVIMSHELLKKWDKRIKAIQGFITSDNRFLNREDSYLVALAAGQVKENTVQSLISEDLY